MLETKKDTGKTTISVQKWFGLPVLLVWFFICVCVALFFSVLFWGAGKSKAKYAPTEKNGPGAMKNGPWAMKNGAWGYEKRVWGYEKQIWSKKTGFGL